MPEMLTVYKTDEWVAVIVTDETGAVLDCQVTPRPLSDFARRMYERERTPRRYKNKRTLTAKNFDEESMIFEQTGA